MVTEDYCSYEVAKLLKEKGFDEQTVRCYNLKKELCACQCNVNETINSTPNYLIAAPTLQMAMKWLREYYHLYIQINWYQLPLGYGPEVVDVKRYETVACIRNKGNEYDTPEQACEAAIKYCLENFI